MFMALFFCFTIHWAEYSQALQITIKQDGRGIWQGQIQQFLCKIQVNSVQTYGQFSWPTSVSISVLVCLHPGWSTHPCQIVFHVTDTTTSYKSCLNEGRACEAFIVSVDWPAVNFEKRGCSISQKTRICLEGLFCNETTDKDQESIGAYVFFSICLEYLDVFIRIGDRESVKYI